MTPAAPGTKARGISAKKPALLLGNYQREFRPPPAARSPQARTLLHPALRTSAAGFTCPRPGLCSFWTRAPGGSSGAPTWIPSPTRFITCPVPAAAAAGPGQARPPTPGGSGSADCPAVRSGAGTAMTARGNSVTAAEGRGPWLETAGLDGRWAPSLLLLQPGHPGG